MTGLLPSLSHAVLSFPLELPPTETLVDPRDSVSSSLPISKLPLKPSR
jgi:hypothetical protein